MNKDLQAIMARRRQLAESDKASSSGNDEQATGGGGGGSGGSATTTKPSASTATTTTTPQQQQHMQSPLHSSTKSGQDLQAIMARRRRLADGEAAAAGGAAAADEGSSQRHGESSSSSSLFHASSGRSGGQGPGRLQQQQNQQFDATISPAKKQPTTAPAVVVRTWSGTSPAASDQPSPRLLAEPSATSSPVKASLKGVDMSSDLQAVMRRRRRLAGGDSEHGSSRGGGNDDDEDAESSSHRSSSHHSRSSRGGVDEGEPSPRPQPKQRPLPPPTPSPPPKDASSSEEASSEEEDPPAAEQVASSPSIEPQPTDELVEERSSSSEEEEESEQEPPPPKKVSSKRKDMSAGDEQTPPPPPPPPPKKTASMHDVSDAAADEDAERQPKISSSKKERPSRQKQQEQRRKKDNDPEEEEPSSAHDDESSSHAAPSPSSAARQRSLRRSHRQKPDRSASSGGADYDEQSVDSRNSSSGNAGTPQQRSRKPVSRLNRRASTSSTGSGDDPTTSLESLHRKNRRQGSSVRQDSDDYSRTESVASSRDGGDRRGSGRRKGQRRASTASCSGSSEASVGSSDDPKRRGSDAEGQSHRPHRKRSGRRRSDSPEPSPRPDEGAKKSSSRRSKWDKADSSERNDESERGGDAWASDFPAPSPATTQQDRIPGWTESAGQAPPRPSTFATTSSGFGAFDDDANFPASESGMDVPGFGGFVASEQPKEFGSFGDQGFPAPTGTAISEGTTSITPTQTGGFNADFGANDGFGAFGSDANPFASQPQQTLFDAPKETSWDTSPLVDMPRAVQSKVSLHLKSMYSKSFVGKPIVNPLNGNIIFCAKGHNGAFLHEVDPRRSYMQVSSAPVMSTELQRRLAVKYNVSASNLEDVITLTAGIQHSHGQARVRVAAILDLKVLESHQLMRVVAVWQWGHSSPSSNTLQFAMTPPSGGDFSYDSSSLQVADGLMFVAGSSPKGPCVFMCKPTVRETWSANFLSGTGRVTSMSVTPYLNRDFPFLAVALSDRSVSIWTYKTALSGTASKANEPSKRWLFPLCRLDASATFQEVEASSFGDGKNYGGTFFSTSG